MLDDIDITQEIRQNHEIRLKFDTQRDMSTFCRFIEAVNNAVQGGKNTLEHIRFVEWFEEDGRFMQAVLLDLIVPSVGVSLVEEDA